jgi:site-specific recombinase XerD
MPLDNHFASINNVLNMDNTYNLYNFEYKFVDYLQAKKYGLGTVRSYVSDLHLFFEWLAQVVDFKSIGLQDNPEYAVAQLLTVGTIQGYFVDLISRKAPNKTVLRRLSSLQLFCSFCINQMWITENPVKELRKVLYPAHKDNPYSVISEFKIALESEHTSPSTVKNYLADIREFISIISSN